MTRKKGPKPALADQAASLSELRAMTPSERARKTCGHCQVTYRGAASAKECGTWHRTGS